MRRLLTAIFLCGTLAWAGAQAALSPGFDVFRLGMSLADLKSALKNNSFFLYSGEPDVSLLTKPNTNLIEVPGITFFTRGVFQVVNGKLYSMSFDLDRDHVDYFGMYTALTKKYGDPTALDPASARWENASVRLSLEKPLTVKYIDMKVFQSLQNQGRAEKAAETLTREKFLENF